MVKLGNLSLSLRSLSLDHETEDGDTIASINKYLEDNLEEYRRFRQLGQSIVGEDADIPEKLEIELDADAPTAATATPEAPKARRGRKSKNQSDPATAVAPPPAPVPGATVPPAPVTAPAAPVDTTPNANGIPAFLDRAVAPAAPPAPPVGTLAPAAPVATMAPPPPPGAPAAPKPPVGTLAPKVVADLRARATANREADPEGKQLVDWLVSAALVVPNATFEEAMECLQFLDDAKLTEVAKQLGIS